MKSTAERGPTALHKYRGTGFEEYYADPPMTPAEAKEERENIYNKNLPFVDRVESCIQRFRSRRRIDAQATPYFNKYLFLGGIDTSPRMFGGNTDADTRDLTPEERREATAIDTVYSSGGGSRFYNADNSDGWDVDFVGVAAGFFSDTLPGMADWDYLLMGKAIGVVENFLTYVRYHDVCPEYDENIKEALALCNTAKKDLPLTHQALRAFPGQFNLALSEMFCEDWCFSYDEESQWGFVRPESFMPEVVAKVGIAMAGSVEQTTALANGMADKSIKVIDEEECYMEVVSLQRPDEQVRTLARQIRATQDSTQRFAPIGTAVLKPCRVEDGYDYGDVQLSEKEETFFLDDSILARLRPGFKLQLCVCELSIGIKFVKQARLVLVEWHTFLPQSLMFRFKEPVANERAAPSVACPGAEEDEGNSSMEKTLSDA